MIVDDERLARERVRRLLSKEADIDIVAEAEDGDLALTRVREGGIDLMLLDVQMPRMGGLNLLRELRGTQMPVTIFLTASREWAVDAFELSVVDYLLKPVGAHRMVAALQRARTRLAELSKNATTGRAKLTRLLVRKGQREQLVRVEAIDWIEADGNYVTLHCGEEQHLIRESLGDLEQRLAAQKFLRVSRSVLINLDQAKELRHSGKTIHVVLAGGVTLHATCGLRELRDRMQFMSDV